VAELLDRWMTVRQSGDRAWRPRTVKYHDDNMRLHIAPALGERLADDVQPADLSLFYASLAKKGLDDTSRHHVYATIRTAYSWAQRNDLVARNPAMLLAKSETPQERRRARAVWTHEQVLRALREASGELHQPPKSPQLVYGPLVLGAWAGLRCGEICGLRWSAVDLEAGGLFVARSLSQTKGGELDDLEPKTRAGTRWIPLSSQAAGVLREHKRRQDELRMARGRRWNREGWVICTAAGGPVKPSNLSSAWARFCRVHKLPPVRLHDLRHSFATAIFEQGGESMLVVVQTLLGHADPTITTRTYLHMTPCKVAAAIAAQEAAIAAARDSLQDGHSEGTRVVALKGRKA